MFPVEEGCGGKNEECLRPLNHLPIALAGCNSLPPGLSSIAAHFAMLIGRQAHPSEIRRCVGKPTDHDRKIRGHPGKTAVWIAQFAD
jgi:hypothetical protein